MAGIRRVGIHGMGAIPLVDMGNSTDAIPWTPASPTTDGGLRPEHWYRSVGPLWQDAGITPATADGDPVGRWEDIATNADHVNQADASKKPSLQNGVGDVLNGYPVVRCDGTNDYVQGAYITGGIMNQPNTAFGVTKLNAGAVNDDTADFFIDGDDATNRHILGKGATPDPDEFLIYAGAALYGNVANSNWNIWTALFNGASSQYWLNGVSQAVGNAGAHNPDGLTIGAGYSGGAPWDGDIVEIILYDANLSDADKNQVGQYLATRYGLSYTDI